LIFGLTPATIDAWLLIVIGRALALAFRGHRNLFLEKMALRTALRRTTRRSTSKRATDCFGSPWLESGGTGAQHWSSCSRTPLYGGIAIGPAADEADVRNPDWTAVHRSIRRFASSSERWRRLTRRRTEGKVRENHGRSPLLPLLRIRTAL
jgi:hypothetical protein